MTVAVGVSLGALSAAQGAFVQARPIWPEGKQTEMNLFVGFRSQFEATSADRPVLRVTASTVYRAFLNGTFLGYGPARAAHGSFRVDEWDLRGRLRPGSNVVAIEVAGYNANSFYLLDQPSFLQAEVTDGQNVLCHTGGADTNFSAHILPQRAQHVQRYSFQRPFTEYYRLTPDCSSWMSDIPTTPPAVKAADQPGRSLLERRIPYPRFSCLQPIEHVAGGTLNTDVTPANPYRDRSLTDIGPKLKGFPEPELEVCMSAEVEKMAIATTASICQPWEPSSRIALPEKGFHIVDFGRDLTGFIGATVQATTATKLYMAFDEMLTNGDVDFRRLGAVNIVGYELQPGTYRIETFEPYTLRYLKFLAPAAGCQISDVYIREYANDDVWQASFAASDPKLNQVFEAGRETYRQNAVDLFMDCPSRERAGWLCDSFFSARTAADLSGNALIEKNFLENFAVAPSFEHIPGGMLPMCYPSDHYDGVFIPNWAMWFVVELEEYVHRTGDDMLAKQLEPRVMALFDYLKQFANEDGLLEDLPGWVFVEWSKANDFVKGVNYPSNMLYVGALDAAARLYEQNALAGQAQAIRSRIQTQSFNGEFFVDNAVRDDKKLRRTNNVSEVCQYYAFLFGAASPDTHAKLFKQLCEQFGPQRAQTNAFPDVHPANAFIGYQLRLELLSRAGESQEIAKELLGYFEKMAQATGTLWEHGNPTASCNHGFSSHAVHALYRDVLGLYAIDPHKHTVHVRLPKTDLNWCEGRMPVGQGFVALRWWREGEQIFYRLNTPAGYSVKVDNLSGREAVRAEIGR